MLKCRLCRSKRANATGPAVAEFSKPDTLKYMTCATTTVKPRKMSDSASKASQKRSYPGRRRSDHIYLSRNFAPVQSETVTMGVPVTMGKLPICLDGEYLRNGPNPQIDFRAQGMPYHWFDGDGMVHGVVLKGGAVCVTYVNKWVLTERFVIDRARGYGFAEQGEVANGNLMVMAEAMDGPNGVMKGRANTNVQYHAGSLMALHEGDVPYKLSLPYLDTLGRHDFGGKLQHRFTAHPKRDLTTGEMVFFGCDQGPVEPWAYYGLLDKQGALVRSFPIPGLRGPAFMHDMAMTEHYSILLEFPLFLRFKDVDVTGNGGWSWEGDTKPTRIGVLPRHAPSGQTIQWFSAPACFAFHVANAWESSKEEITLVMCVSDRMDFKLNKAAPTYLEKMVIDLSRVKPTERTRLLCVKCEFPVTALEKQGRYSRYIYCVRMGPPAPGHMDALIKYDMETGKHWIHKFADGMFGGECIFVKDHNELAEDAGYLMTFTHNEKTGISEFYLIDAQSMDATPVARVRLPTRVPYGFHGTWVSAKEIREQQQAQQQALQAYQAKL
eukprot:gb/GEZN01001797.1/.p1 GENE.gb/GEZN01001797.1/~~gb/GEZN01001797.1/.p1  ORF type:complete len:552 (+),score=44.05 gb/GEZN01001797.1/:890-2545(+)